MAAETKPKDTSRELFGLAERLGNSPAASGQKGGHDDPFSCEVKENQNAAGTPIKISSCNVHADYLPDDFALRSCRPTHPAYRNRPGPRADKPADLLD
jgi:hypothetical protein